ncbi:MAG: glycosyltransferase family 4 protein, partial [Bacillota bacterium]
MYQKRILLIGPETNKRNPHLTGGVIVLFEHLIKDLRKLNIEFTVVDTNMANYPNAVSGILLIYWKILKNISKVDHISLHGTVNNYLFIGPFIILLSLLSKKKVSLRKFAGSFHEVYESSGKFKRKLIEAIIRNADFTFYETRYLVEYFKKWNRRTYWFPNVREREIFPSEIPRHFSKKFVFISHVIKSKGIELIREAVKEFDNSYKFDIYGPILNSEYSEADLVGQNLSYRGPLRSDEVLKVLNLYDVLLLPSYREGYPGIIIEAFSLGIPVISTTLESVKELVEDRKEGHLIEPGNVKMLVEAIRNFDECSYSVLSANAFKKFKL